MFFCLKKNFAKSRSYYLILYLIKTYNPIIIQQNKIKSHDFTLMYIIKFHEHFICFY
jgi:hypothetical protein